MKGKNGGNIIHKSKNERHTMVKAQLTTNDRQNTTRTTQD